MSNAGQLWWSKADVEPKFFCQDSLRRKASSARKICRRQKSRSRAFSDLLDTYPNSHVFFCDTRIGFDQGACPPPKDRGSQRRRKTNPKSLCYCMRSAPMAARRRGRNRGIRGLCELSRSAPQVLARADRFEASTAMCDNVRATRFDRRSRQLLYHNRVRHIHKCRSICPFRCDDDREGEREERDVACRALAAAVESRVHPATLCLLTEGSTCS